MILRLTWIKLASLSSSCGSAPSLSTALCSSALPVYGRFYWLSARLWTYMRLSGRNSCRAFFWVVTQGFVFYGVSKESYRCAMISCWLFRIDGSIIWVLSYLFWIIIFSSSSVRLIAHLFSIYSCLNHRYGIDRATVHASVQCGTCLLYD